MVRDLNKRVLATLLVIFALLSTGCPPKTFSVFVKNQTPVDIDKFVIKKSTVTNYPATGIEVKANDTEEAQGLRVGEYDFHATFENGDGVECSNVDISNQDIGVIYEIDEQAQIYCTIDYVL